MRAVAKSVRRYPVLLPLPRFTRMALFAGACGALGQAGAATITVKDSSGNGDGTTCTLYQAIASANSDMAGISACVAGSGTDTIVFDPAVTTNTVNNVLSVLSNVTIDGGAGGVTVSDASSPMIFLVFGGATATFKNLTVTDSYVSGGFGIGNGGTLTLDHCTVTGNTGVYGIKNSGTLTVTNNSVVTGSGVFNIYNLGTATVDHSTVSSSVGRAGFSADGIYSTGPLTVSYSTVTQNAGWGIRSKTGTLTIDHGSTISGNSSGGIDLVTGNTAAATISDSTISGNLGGTGRKAAGIAHYASGTLTVTDSIITGNHSGGLYNGNGTAHVYDSTLSGNTAQYGGGVFNDLPATLVIRQSTLSGNTATVDGAGLANYGTATIANSTFSGNSATQNGGAVYNYNNNALTIINATLAGDSAAVGGEIFDSPGNVVAIANSIIANATAGGNCSGSITDNGGNLDSGTTCGFTAGTSLSNTNPQLGALADNGGPTLTMLSALASPVIDAGVDSVCAMSPVNAVDQRGASRPRGAHCDIGAVERLDRLFADNFDGHPVP